MSFRNSSSKSSSTSNAPTKNSSDKKTLNILYIEDSEIDYKIYSRSIRKSLQDTFEVNIINCDNLADSTEKLSSKSFDLLIIDLNIVDSSGYNTFEEVKKNCKNETPIIILTGIEDPNIMNKCLEAGNENYFVKGVNDRNIIGKLLSICLDQTRMRERVKNLNIKASNYY